MEFSFKEVNCDRLLQLITVFDAVPVKLNEADVELFTAVISLTSTPAAIYYQI